MPIPFVPYQKEYKEQIKILAALLRGKLESKKGTTLQPPSLFPWLTGAYHDREVQIGIVEQVTREGTDPLSTDKYLLVAINCTCNLEMKIGPKERSWKLARLLWWRHISTGNKALDSNHSITTSERARSRRLLSHKKAQNLLLQLSPFQTLQLTDRRLSLRYLITSHEVFIARNLAERLRQLDRLARLAENLT